MAKKLLGDAVCECGATTQIYDDGRKCISICEECGLQKTWQRRAARDRIRAAYSKQEQEQERAKVCKPAPEADNTDAAAEEITDKSPINTDAAPTARGLFSTLFQS